MSSAIPGLAQTSAASPPTTADPTGSSALGKDDFLKLLMAQLQNQDPTAPTDDSAFVAQLAQFSALEQAQGTNSRLDQLLAAQTSTTQTAAVDFIGKVVDFRTDTMNLEAGLATTADVTLGGNAAKASAQIVDATGRVVRTLQLPAQVAGTVPVTWDGNDDVGTRQPPGAYTLRVTATDAAGNSVPVSLQGSGAVAGVAFDNGVPGLLVNGTTVRMSQVTSINERTTP
jgi:flagellar basal-body rod modification protein FlgD